MTSTIFFATAGMGRKAEGSALVAKDGFSARYDLDRDTNVCDKTKPEASHNDAGKPSSNEPNEQNNQ